MLHQQVKSLTQDLANFVQGRENLDKLVGQQRCAFNKVGLGFHEHKNTKSNTNLFVKSSTFIFTHHML